MSIHHQTPFDEWVEEAPFRHLGIFILGILAIMALLVGCGPRTTQNCVKYGMVTTRTVEHLPNGATELTVRSQQTCTQMEQVVTY